MRSLVFVAIGYLLLVAWGVLAEILPLHLASPDLALLVALYLGLSDESRLPSALGASLAVGLFADALSGAPNGLFASAAVVVCLLGQKLSGRFFVRGVVPVALAGAMASLIGGTLTLVAQAEAFRIHRLRDALTLVLAQALLTAIVAPPCFALFHRVDARRAASRAARRAVGAFS